ASTAAAQHPAFLSQFWTSRPVNRAIHTATAKQRAICRVDDSINSEAGNVTGDDQDAFRHTLASFLPFLRAAHGWIIARCRERVSSAQAEYDQSSSRHSGWSGR